ncbi:MAG: DUF4360 domain-containing protein [Oligoflexia bacterium]|nr:DUF4360 domain-containing protein [Oligoflexia bacterium]
MKTGSTRLTILGILLTVSLAQAHAEEAPRVQLGEPAVRGNGCLPGTARAALSPDGGALSVIFDRYIAESGGTAAARDNRKHCSLAIPMTVPAGYSVAVMRVDYRGFNSLPEGGASMFRAKFGIRTRRAFRASRDLAQQFAGPLDSDFLISHSAEGQIWSECGGPIEMHLNTFLDVKTNFRKDQALITVDSADITAERGMTYILEWRRCR